MEPMEPGKKPRSVLLKEEDWWTVWFGLFFILIATIYGALHLSGNLPKIPKPKMGSWVTNPLDAFNAASKKKVKIKPDMTITTLAEKINKLSSKVKAEIVEVKPLPTGSTLPNAVGASISSKNNQNMSPSLIKKVGEKGKAKEEKNPAEEAKELEPPPAPEPVVPSKYRLEISSTRTGPGQTIKAKMTLKKDQSFKFTAVDKDPNGLGAMKYVSEEFDSPDKTIGSGILNVNIERNNKILIPIILALLIMGLVSAVGIKVMGEKAGKFMSAFAFIAALTFLSLFIASQTQIKAWGIGYAFWALLFGLLISNTIGTPKWIMPAVKTEMFIKTGLVLLGAEILFGKILKLGVPGLMVAWIVTPTVVIFMYIFGIKTLKMVSKPLVMIIAMATSVCGVSAAIAAAAATRAKKEELTLGVGMTLIFTVLMMIFMPLAILAMGMDPILGGAWIGGVVDSTGAVVAAGAMLGADAETVAAVVKMVQNVLIGVLGFIVAVIWVTRVERDKNAPKPSPIEIWTRFPKFIVGFVLASILFSFVLIPIFGSVWGKAASIWSTGLPLVESNVIKIITNPLRGLFFCLAFVSIGLESNFRDLASQMVGGKPIILYIVGQSFNLILTLLIAWLAFIKFFPNAI